MTEEQSEMTFRFTPKTKYTGLVVNVSSSMFKAYRDQAREFQTYNDVEVTIDGVTKTFTLNEFRRALGMDRRED